jgi:hypothetical protein
VQWSHEDLETVILYTCFSSTANRVAIGRKPGQRIPF